MDAAKVAADDVEGSLDVPTAMAIAALVYVLSTAIHEVCGHGGACVLVGAHVRTIGAYYLNCDTQGLPLWASRVVAAAGSTANACAALLGLTALFLAKKVEGAGKVFLWLLITVNALTWAGYFGFSGVSGVGDWSGGKGGVLYGLPDLGLWRLALIAGALILYTLVMYGSAALLGFIIGRGSGGLLIARRLTFSAYITGGVVSVLVGLLNPEGWFVVVASAAASSFGGTAGMLRVAKLMPRNSARAPLRLERSGAWIVTAALVVIAYAVILGPSITVGR